MDELEWIQFLKKHVKKTKGVLVSIGDDCAVITHRGGYLLFTSDLFVENVHFKKGRMKLQDVGRRAVARALSDVVACGGIPKFLGASCGVPPSFSGKNMKAVYKGIEEYCAKYNVSLVGGDTSRAREFFLDMWVVGEAQKYILRSTARRGDYIFLTGPLGKIKFDEVFDLRVKEVQRLIHRYKVNAMIDVSDGFVLDLSRILQESGKGAVIYGNCLPLTRGMGDLFRGEDYELIFTVSKNENISKLKKKYFYVGEIKNKEFGYKIDIGGKLKEIDVKGYLHF